MNIFFHLVQSVFGTHHSKILLNIGKLYNIRYEKVQIKKSYMVTKIENRKVNMSPMGLQCSKKIKHLEVSLSWPLNKNVYSFVLLIV